MTEKASVDVKVAIVGLVGSVIMMNVPLIFGYPKVEALIIGLTIAGFNLLLIPLYWRRCRWAFVMGMILGVVMLIGILAIGIPFLLHAFFIPDVMVYTVTYLLSPFFLLILIFFSYKAYTETPKRNPAK